MLIDKKEEHSHCEAPTHLGNLALSAELHLGLDRLDDGSLHHSSLVAKAEQQCEKSATIDNPHCCEEMHLRVVRDNRVSGILALIRLDSDRALGVEVAAHDGL